VPCAWLLSGALEVWRLRYESLIIGEENPSATNAGGLTKEKNTKNKYSNSEIKKFLQYSYDQGFFVTVRTFFPK